MQIIGMKYLIYENDERKVRRIVRMKSEDSYVLKEDGNDTNFITTIDELHDKYVRIDPDAFLNIMITNEAGITDEADIKDVYICVNRATDYAAGSNNPALILRQNYYSKFKNIASIIGNNIYIGECATINNSTSKELLDMMQFKSIEKSFSIAVYIDDSITDMLNCIPNKFKKDINAELCLIKQSMYNPMICGATESIEELMESNDFMYNFKSIFNIMQIDFPIILGDSSYNDDGDIVINNKQKSRLEDLLKRYISNVKVIKYEKDIDISKVVCGTHSVICDENNEIFLITYDIDGYYADGNEDEDIIKSMLS